MTLQEWTAGMIDGTAPKAIGDMPTAMRNCTDTDARAAFLVAYRESIKRKTPNECSYETLASNLGYMASEWEIPASWAKAVRLAFPKVDRPLAANSVAHENEYGRKITDNVLKMIAAADKTQRQRHCTMNDHTFIANPGDTIEEVYAEFAVENMISSFHHAARRRFGHEFAKIGEKIFDLIADRDV